MSQGNALAIIAAAFAAVASGGTIQVYGIDGSRGAYELVLNERGVDTGVYFAGVIDITLTENGYQFNRDTLCVDLFTDINIGSTYNTTLLTPAEVPGKHLQRVSWLVDNALAPAQDSRFVSTLPQTDWVRTAAQGAGIQFAIWDIVHDGGDGFAAGSIQAPGNVAAGSMEAQVLGWAAQYETLSAGKASDFAFVYGNISFDGIEAQMLAGPKFTDGGPTPPLAPHYDGIDSPEPGTMALSGAALLAIGFLARRRSTRYRRP